MGGFSQKLQQSTSVESAPPRRAPAEPDRAVRPLLGLQRTIGNQTLQRMIQALLSATRMGNGDRGPTQRAPAIRAGAAPAQVQRAEGSPGEEKASEVLHDDGIVTITVEKGQTLFSIAKKYGTTVDALQQLNKLQSTDIKEGQKLKVPASLPPGETAKTSTTGQAAAETDTSTGTPDKATKTSTGTADKQQPDAGTAANPGDEKKATVRGDLEGKKRLLVAWTIDDGPRGKTTERMKTEGMGGIPQATWFIQYANIKPSDWQKLRDVQTAGGEIAIHSFYPDDDHAAWFPKVKGGAYGHKHTDDDMATRMGMLKQFNEKLKAEKIYPKFVRLPGGLISELANYAAAVGYAKNWAVAKAVVAGEDLTAHGEQALQIKADFDTLKATLNDLNLLLWGSGDTSVNVAPASIGQQEWTAETSGASGRQDYTTDVVDPFSKDVPLPGGHGSFERLIATMKDEDVKGMVILTHDTMDKPDAQDDIRAVKDDRDRMEKVCAENGIRLEYHTMSSLFTIVTENDITTYKAAY